MELADALAGVVGSSQVLVADDVVDSYVRDWTGRFVGSTPAVVRPGSLDEVVAVVEICRERGVAIVPQGGNTGLVGGSVPLDGEVVLSLRRLDHVGQVDVEAMEVTAGAGASIAAVAAAAAEAGLAYGVDLASRQSATVGGTVATNAGGLNFLRWGGTRQQLRGAEAVLGDGSVVSHLNALPKDNTGYDLSGLLCGSEGTLGVVTAAKLRLVPAAGERAVALVALESAEMAVRLAIDVHRSLDLLEAAELMTGVGVELVCEVEDLPLPFPRPWPAYVLLEAASAHADPTDRLAAAVERATVVVGDVAVATDSARREALWAYREQHTTAVNTLGAPHKLDVTLPLGRLAEFVEEIPKVMAAIAPGARTWLFGHVADGNVHVNITGLEPDDEVTDGKVLRLVAAYGGSISAEHGIGRAKLPWLHLSRGPGDIAAFRKVKAALDPAGILNPGVLTPPPG